MTTLSDFLTIIITTSPIRSHPSTYVLDKVIESFNLIDELNDCKKLIICDGYQIISNNKYKSGKINQEVATNYEIYIESITDKYVNSEVIKRDKRYGFAENVRYALELVRTEYVIIIQHDQIFLRNINFKDIIHMMTRHHDINYINFISLQTINYETKLISRYNTFYEEYKKESDLCGLSIMPLLFWYDKPHICRTSYYKDYVFGGKHLILKTRKRINVKNFIEDSFGQVVKENIKIGGYGEFRKYNSFLYYDDPDNPAIAHIDGRTCDLKYKLNI